MQQRHHNNMRVSYVYTWIFLLSDASFIIKQVVCDACGVVVFK